jgi:hypothetical protein
MVTGDFNGQVMSEDEAEGVEDYADGFPEPPDAIPSVFRFRIGGRGCENVVTWSEENKLLSVVMEDGDSAEVEVSSSQWKTFWFVVDQLGVWTWRSDYEDPNVIDGTSWELVIVDGSRRIFSRGSNAYPGGFDEQDENSPFKQLLAAINMLAGRDDIE